MQIRLGPNRVGPRGWLQPIADALKLFSKEDIIPGRAEKLVFLLGPVLVTAPALVVFSVIPFGPAQAVRRGADAVPHRRQHRHAASSSGSPRSAIYGIILGGWASNNKFSLMGGLRSAAQLISYEVPMGFSVVAVVLMAN